MKCASPKEEKKRETGRAGRSVYAAGELPSDIIEAVRGAAMDPRHKHLDRLVEDWRPRRHD